MLLASPFVFMRHGETPLNRDGLIGGSTDVPLTRQGEDQARSARPILERHWSKVVTSSRLRARQTTELAVPGQGFTSLPGLDERDWGQLECAPLAHQTPYLNTPPGGEDWESFEARVVAALNTTLAAHPYPLIIAHSGVYRVIQRLVRGRPEGPRLPNARPLLIRPGPLGWTFHLLGNHDDRQDIP